MHEYDDDELFKSLLILPYKFFISRSHFASSSKCVTGASSISPSSSSSSASVSFFRSRWKHFSLFSKLLSLFSPPVEFFLCRIHFLLSIRPRNGCFALYYASLPSRGLLSLSLFVRTHMHTHIYMARCRASAFTLPLSLAWSRPSEVHEKVEAG